MTQTNGTHSKDLAEGIAAATSHVKALEAEQAAIPRALIDAAEAADETKLITLRQRENEIGIFISAAQIRLAKLQLERCEYEQPIKQEERKRVAEKFARAEEKFTAAKAERDQALNELEYPTAAERDVQLRLGDFRRRLSQLMAEARPRAPVR